MRGKLIMDEKEFREFLEGYVRKKLDHIDILVKEYERGCYEVFPSALEPKFVNAMSKRIIQYGIKNLSDEVLKALAVNEYKTIDHALDLFSEYFYFGGDCEDIEIDRCNPEKIIELYLETEDTGLGDKVRLVSDRFTLACNKLRSLLNYRSGPDEYDAFSEASISSQRIEMFAWEFASAVADFPVIDGKHLIGDECVEDILRLNFEANNNQLEQVVMKWFKPDKETSKDLHRFFAEKYLEYFYRKDEGENEK